MSFEDLFSRVALALGIGLLIGLERGWRLREAGPGDRAAGIRTFAVSGLLGGIAGALSQTVAGQSGIAAGLVLAAGFATYAGVIAAFSRDENKADGTFSATTAVAGMLTFALGAYALLGDVRIAAVAAGAATALLAVREQLHGWVARIAWPELRSGLVLLTMTFIALPIVPQVPIGPFGGVNPHEVWIVAILLASVSFGGYIAVKYLGPRPGVLLAAAAGGLVSSTAVTLANARLAAAGEGASHLLSAGVAVATAVSLLRVVALGATLQPSLLLLIGPPLIAAAGVAMGLALLPSFRRGAGTQREKQRENKMDFRNPFSFWTVIGFAIFLGVTMVLGQALGQTFGAAGAIFGAIAIGFADVDSATVSMANLMPVPLSQESTAYAILAAAASNSVGKVAICAALGRNRFAVDIGVLVVACCLAGAMVSVLTGMFLSR